MAGARLIIGLEARADLHLVIGRQLAAGLDAARALAGARGIAGGRHDDAIGEAARLVRAGRGLADAGRLAGLWTNTDHRLVRHAEQAGDVARALAMLAESYRRRGLRLRRARGQMLMPTFVLALGLLVGPLPALVSGEIGAGSYLLRSLGPLLGVVLVVVSIARATRGYLARGLPRWAGIVAAAPGLRSLALAHDRARALDVIAMRHAAGLPAADALRGLGADLLDRRLGRGLDRAARGAARGDSLAPSLRDTGLIDDGAGYAALSTSEEAGRVDEGLARAAAAAADRLDAVYELAAQWMPRVVYGAVVLWVVSAVL